MKKLMIVGILVGLVAVFFAGRMSAPKEVFASPDFERWYAADILGYDETSAQATVKFLNKNKINEFKVLYGDPLQVGILYRK